MRLLSRIVAAGVLLTAAALTTTPACAAGMIRFEGLTPQPGAEVEYARPAIAFDLVAEERVDIDASDIHVLLDGHDVSNEIAIDGSHVSYVPARALDRGSHTVQVRVDEPGGAKSEDAWSFVTTVNEATADDSMLQSPQADADSDQDAAVAFYAAATVPYYAPGTFVRFIVTGPYGGHGYVVFPGLGGTFPLIPYAPGYYYVIIPIPIAYGITNPPVACRFFAPGHRALTVPLRRPIAIRSAPATLAAARAAQPAYIMSPAVNVSVAKHAPAVTVRRSYAPVTVEGAGGQAGAPAFTQPGVPYAAPAPAANMQPVPVTVRPQAEAPAPASDSNPPAPRAVPMHAPTAPPPRSAPSAPNVVRQF